MRIKTLLKTCFAWNPWSWKDKVQYQMPEYPHHAQKNFRTTIQTLEKHAPLIFAGEADNLKHNLHQAALGHRFMITGGDCAETFSDFSPDKIRKDLQLLMQISLITGFLSGLPTLQIGRMAGQFAKPRSSPFEIVDNKTYPSFRGDIINDYNLSDRNPKPERMLTAYHQSTQTLNLLRAFIQGGYTQISRIQDWKFHKFANADVDWCNDTLERIRQSLSFYQTFQNDDFRLDNFYTGHECLLLPYEAALTRKDSLSGSYYDCSAHFLWLGERTRKLDSAQVEFLRGVENPIGIKISHQWESSELLRLMDILDPSHEPGKLTIITRMGVKNILKSLPRLIRLVQSTERQVVWCCDPMHGNTFSLDDYKTRSFQDIKDEISAFFDVHRVLGTIPGGIHLEMTNKNVTECLGGSVDEVRLYNLSNHYESRCDPRLNGIQALELAFLIGQKLKDMKTRGSDLL